jgi:hypothetical protein
MRFESFSTILKQIAETPNRQSHGLRDRCKNKYIKIGSETYARQPLRFPRNVSPVLFLHSKQSAVLTKSSQTLAGVDSSKVTIRFVGWTSGFVSWESTFRHASFGDVIFAPKTVTRMDHLQIWHRVTLILKKGDITLEMSHFESLKDTR